MSVTSVGRLRRRAAQRRAAGAGDPPKLRFRPAPGGSVATRGLCDDVHIHACICTSVGRDAHARRNTFPRLAEGGASAPLREAWPFSLDNNLWPRATPGIVTLFFAPRAPPHRQRCGRGLPARTADSEGRPSAPLPGTQPAGRARKRRSKTKKPSPAYSFSTKINRWLCRFCIMITSDAGQRSRLNWTFLDRTDGQRETDRERESVCVCVCVYVCVIRARQRKRVGSE